VLLIGDSLAEGTAPYLPGLLRGRQVTQDYGVGRNLSTGISELRGDASTLPPILVLSLGTNDVPTPSSFGPLVNEALSIAGNRCVIWPDIVRPASGGYNWDDANAVLAAAASTHPSLHVVPWSTMVRSHPEWLAGDGVHVNTTGYSARAQAIADAVAGC
jgi:lysophospholipase L1-like esterase